MKHFLLAVLVAVAACSKDSSGPVTPNLQGSWNMVAINTFPLPYAISDQNGVRTEVIAEVMTITQTSFTRTGTYRYTSNTGVTTQQGTVTGAYTWDGRAIFDYGNNLQYWGALSSGDNKLTVHFGLTAVEYQRQ